MQQQPQTIPFDVILDDFLAKQQGQLNTVRMLIKNLRDKNVEVVQLQKELEEYQTPVENKEDETDD